MQITPESENPIRGCVLCKENHSLNEWFHEPYGGKPKIQVPEKGRNK